jgi:serine/threonine protein kinase
MSDVAGLPYFVMELVHGVPITKYCDDNHLTPRERLELFVPVCQAILHAHQKGIFHRDIEPSNVMITLYEGKPVWLTTWIENATRDGVFLDLFRRILVRLCVVGRRRLIGQRPCGSWRASPKTNSQRRSAENQQRGERPSMKRHPAHGNPLR